ncbi:hypothetical protein C7I55_20335 [Sphingomonas deserti]|uniref:Glycerophosphoryl diester phosphodiesterase membrane domain-containing protein n=2 Tax=Allosphingosinicella deserti TaxID=2116704 RepID=A0A2P7QJ82_9SPHN|nr:hypothetical protein C7I55_20335 [Sphingomonas deserti]
MLTGGSFALQASLPESDWNLLIEFVVLILAQYAVTKRLLKRRFGDVTGDRLAVVFAISLLSTAAILFGYCALIAPGVLLSVRWFSAIPIALSGNLGIGDALRKSWQTAEGHGSAVFGVLLILYAPMIILLIAVVIASFNGDLFTAEPAPLATVAIDAVTNLTVVTSWYAAIAFLELRIPRKTALEEVFA